MKRSLFAGMLVVCAVLVGTGTAAGADPYVRLGGIVVLPSTSDVENTFGVGDSGTVDFNVAGGFIGAVGVRSGGLHFDVDLGVRKAKIEDSRITYQDVEVSNLLSGHLTTTTLMANARYALGTPGVKPYVGAGLGVAFHDGEFITSDNSVEITDTTAAYQLMAGLSFGLGLPGLDLLAGWRMIGSGTIKERGVKASFLTHSLEVGLQIPLPL